MVFEFGQMSGNEPDSGGVGYAIVGGLLLLVLGLLVVFGLSSYEPPVRNVPQSGPEPVYVGSFDLIGTHVQTVEEDMPEWNWMLMGDKCGRLSTGLVFCSRI